MNIRQILLGKPVNTIYSVRPDATVYHALELMSEKNIGAVLVMDNGRLVGIFSERDYARKGILMGRASRDTLIHEVMTSRLITIQTSDKLEDAMLLMSQKHIRHLPVVDVENLIGIISINDVVSAIIREQKAQIASLENYISGTY